MKIQNLVMVSLATLAMSSLANAQVYRQTTMSTNVGDRLVDDRAEAHAGQAAGTVGGHDPIPQAADRSDQQDLRNDRRKEQQLQLSPSQRITLAPHAIMVHTELLSAKQEINGIRSQLKSLKGAAPDTETIQHFSLYSKNLNADLKMAATHEAELKGGAANIAGATDNKSFSQMDSSIASALEANMSWQVKAKDAAYWSNADQVKNDVKALSKQIDQALDKNQSFGSDSLNVSYVG